MSNHPCSKLRSPCHNHTSLVCRSNPPTRQTRTVGTSRTSTTADEVEDAVVDGEDAEEEKEVEDTNVAQHLLRWYGTRRLGAYSHPPINLEAQAHLP
jgi:hypothetical protein